MRLRQRLPMDDMWAAVGAAHALLDNLVTLKAFAVDVLTGLRRRQDPCRGRGGNCVSAALHFGGDLWCL